MTSGEFTSYPVESITIDRASRQRREITKVDEMAWSLQEIGQLQPIIITRDGELKIGERRWTAAKQLGWTHIMVQFTDELDEGRLKLMELEENVRRMDLPWQDECAAIAEYHAIRSQGDPEWTAKNTAEALGISASMATEKLAVVKAIASGNELVKDAPMLSTAIGITRREAARRQTSVLADIAPEVTAANERNIPLQLADFIEWQRTYSGPKFNFIHCDFPYGVNADKHNQGAAKSHGRYDDGIEVYESLLETLTLAMENVVADSAHLMFWFSMDYYGYTQQALQKMGWKVSPFPLIWHKSDNSGILPDPSRGPRRIYETAFHASRSDRLVVRSISNVVAAPVTKLVHMSEKNLDMLTKFMEMFVDENTVGLDPTCGSGNAVRAMVARGAHYALGLERDEEFFNKAKEHFYGEG